MNYKGRKKLALIFVALMLVTACVKTDSKVFEKLSGYYSATKALEILQKE